MAKKKQAKKAARPRRHTDASGVSVGTASKYKDLKFLAERVIGLYKDGKNVS